MTGIVKDSPADQSRNGLNGLSNGNTTLPSGSLSMETVLTHYGTDLRTTRNNGWAAVPCCFHDDHVASASVNLGEGRYRCHACGMYGDTLNVIARKEGFGTWEHPDRNAANAWAEKLLGARYHSVCGTAKGRKTGKRPAWRDRLFA